MACKVHEIAAKYLTAGAGACQKDLHLGKRGAQYEQVPNSNFANFVTPRQ